MNKDRLDSLAETIIADAESHMEWADARHLRTKKDAVFFAKLLAGHLEKVAAPERGEVVDRLATFGRCLDVEFDSHDVSKTFLLALADAAGPLPAPHEAKHAEGWSFKTKARGGIRFEPRVKVRTPGGGSIGT